MAPPSSNGKEQSAGINFHKSQLERLDDFVGEYGHRSPFVRDAVDVIFYADNQLKEHGRYVRPHKIDDWVKEAIDEKLERETD